MKRGGHLTSLQASFLEWNAVTLAIAKAVMITSQGLATIGMTLPAGSVSYCS